MMWIVSLWATVLGREPTEPTERARFNVDGLWPGMQLLEFS